MADDVLAAEVAADDERGPRRIERPRRRRARSSVRRQALDGLARPARRPVVGRARRVDRADERLVDAPARIGLGLEEVVQPLVAQPLDLGLGEGRVEEDLGDQLEGRLRAGPPARRRRRSEASQPASAWSEAPEPLGRLDQGDRVVALGALGQGPGGQDGRPGLGRPAPRPRRRAATSDADTSGRPGQVGDQDRQPVGERGAGRPAGTRTAAARRAAGRSATTGPSRPGRSVALMPPPPRRRRARRLVGRERHVVGGWSPRAGRSGRPGCPAGRRPRATSPDRLRRDRQVARQHPVDEPRVVEQRRVHRQAVGPLLDPLERAELVGLDQGLGAGQLVVADRARSSGARAPRWKAASTRATGDAGPDRRPAGRDRRAADEPEA